MNELIIGKPLELSFIMEIHEKEFEQNIIDRYFSTAERFDDIPVSNEIPYDPVFLYASILYDWHGDLEFFKEETTGYADEDDLLHHVVSELNEIEMDDSQLMNEYFSYMTDDIQSVLQFHHLCFLEGSYNPFSGKSTLYIHNEPIVKVW